MLNKTLLLSLLALLLGFNGVALADKSCSDDEQMLKLLSVTDKDGKKYTFCVFRNKSYCEQQAYRKGRCKSGSQRWPERKFYFKPGRYCVDADAKTGKAALYTCFRRAHEQER